MSHRNAPSSVEGRHRLVQRCTVRPIAHLAGEMGISRASHAIGTSIPTLLRLTVRGSLEQA